MPTHCATNGLEKLCRVVPNSIFINGLYILNIADFRGRVALDQHQISLPARYE